MKRIPRIKFPQRHPKLSTSGTTESQANAAQGTMGTRKLSTSKSDVPAPPSTSTAGGKASLQPKRTPVSEKEIEAILFECTHGVTGLQPWGSLPWFCSTNCQNNGIILLLKLIKGVLGILSNICINYKVNTFLSHEVDPPLNNVYLISLHIGHSIHHKPSDSISTLIHYNDMAHFVQLISSSQASRTTPNYSNSFPEMMRHVWHKTSDLGS
ncbi:hypothetical protein Cgig2_005037 [Carnegiea gigantea]|uniref:Uncharacterized protein n=1 Tax=Carnegiea gigantea TaxID=171969 RepID=A0A9Q1QT88_9CARY|nr:hypothetical protein Cgig2_005037 [Carnegiea gigantea]